MSRRLLLLALTLALAHSYPIPPTDGELAFPGRALRTRHVYVHHGGSDNDDLLIVGLVLIVAAPVLLVSAEFTAARFAKLLKQARWMTCADAPSDRPRKRFNAHVVHTQGAMSVGPSWSDVDTGVSWGAAQRRPSLAGKIDESFKRLSKSDDVGERTSVGPLRVKRDVDVFAWKEHMQTSNKTTTYTYDQEWVDASSVQKSSEFKHSAGHHNPPPKVDIKTQTFDRDDVSLGAYTLSTEALHRADWWEPYEVPPTTVLGGKLGGMLGGKLGDVMADGTIYIKSGGPPVGAGEPAIGDMRLRYSIVPCPPGACTAVGLQEDGEVLGKVPLLRPATKADVYKCAGVAAPAGGAPMTGDDVTDLGGDLPNSDVTCSNLCRACGMVTLFVSKLIVWLLPQVIGSDVFILKRGAWRPRIMYNMEEARMDQAMVVLRIVGTILFVVAFLCIFSPLAWLFRWIPLVGRLISTLFFVAALLAGVACATFTIACAWVVVKPARGAILFTLLAIGAAAATLADHAQGCARCDGDPATWPPLQERMLDVAPTVPLSDWLPLLPLIIGALLATASALLEAHRAHAFHEAVRTEMATVARQATAKRLLGANAPGGTTQLL